MSGHDARHELARGVMSGRQAMPAGLDVERAAAFLRLHGLGGLAVGQARAGRGDLPEALLAALESSYHRIALQATLVLESADRARAALREGGIPSLVFKGAALVRSGVYEDPGERLMEDADLLVHPSDAAGAVVCLTEAGFVPWSPWDPSRLGWVPAFTFSDPAPAPGVETSLDLHWDSTYHDLRTTPTAPDADDPLWDGADLEAGLPSPEAHFVLLAEHFLKHVRVVTHARGLADLARLAPTLADGERLARQARRRGGLRAVRTMIALVDGALGARVSDEVVAAIGGRPRIAGVKARLLDLPTLLDPDAADERSRLEGLLLRWVVAGSPMGAVRDLLRVAAPSGDWLRARYPELATSALRARGRYMKELVAWLGGHGASPLSPNQEWSS